MCGICGRVYFDHHTPVDTELIRRMCDVIAHRGPDESGEYIHANVGLGHRRLSIIDLSTGQQPMSNDRHDIWLVYNGEVYNFLELRADLITRGYTFHTTSDTEVIIHLYDEYGTACVTHLRGMFAFALWDARRQRLVLARDRVGQKPLFYTMQEQAISFASEIKSLLQDPRLKRELNLEALHHYLTYQYVPPPNTMFQRIFQLPPAHILVCEHENVTVERYWDLRYVPKTPLDEHDIQEEMTQCLDESVRLRMISDVPLGAFLSGGIDSSLVVAMMSQHSSQPVKTFSIGFHEKEFNELPYARMVAERYQTDHHECIVEPDAVEVLPKLIWHFDEPFGDFSAIPTYYVAQVTSQSVKVALNGDGGDESFAGYERYLGYSFVQYYQVLPERLRATVLASLLKRLSQTARQLKLPAFLRSTLRRLNVLNDLSLLPPQDLYAYTMLIFHNQLKSELVTPDVRKQVGHLNSLDWMSQYFDTDQAEHLTDKMLLSDVMTYLPGDLLVKVDRMTMAHSLEARSPFLDHRLMERAAAIPARMKLRGTTLKYLLKQMGKAYLPDTILSRKKQGFSVPLAQWFREELREMVHDICLSSQLVQAGILEHTTIHRIVQEHQAGTADHRHRIWLLLNLELWYRMCIQGS